MCFYRYTTEKKKYQKAALGLQDSDEDDHEQVGLTDGHKDDVDEEVKMGIQWTLDNEGAP